VFAQSEKPADTSIGNKAAEVSRPTKIVIHGKIVAVDKDEKLVTLEGPDNRKVTLKVDNPYNLQAAKVGEPVVVQFYEVATIRKKQPSEAVPSASVKEGITSAVQGGVPGATAQDVLA